MFYPVCLAAVLLCLPQVRVDGENPQSKNIKPDGWPGQLDRRKLYFFQHSFVYAGRKSDAVAADKRIEAAIEEFEKDNVRKDDTIVGLAVVTGLKEEPLVDVKRLLEALRHRDKREQSEKSQKDLKSLVKAKEDIEKEGLNMDMLLSITPVPIEPNLLPEIVEAFPKEIGEQIDFCVFLPTGGNIKNGFKKVLDAAIKHKKIGLVERLALLPLMPFIESKALDGLKKSQQLIVYERLLEKQTHLTEEQRDEKVRAYKKKLGLGDDSKSYEKDSGKKK
jgi:hypothetical protein